MHAEDARADTWTCVGCSLRWVRRDGGDRIELVEGAVTRAARWLWDRRPLLGAARIWRRSPSAAPTGGWLDVVHHVARRRLDGAKLGAGGWVCLRARHRRDRVDLALAYAPRFELRRGGPGGACWARPRAGVVGPGPVPAQARMPAVLTVGDVPEPMAPGPVVAGAGCVGCVGVGCVGVGVGCVGCAGAPVMSVTLGPRPEPTCAGTPARAHLPIAETAPPTACARSLSAWSRSAGVMSAYFLAAVGCAADAGGPCCSGVVAGVKGALGVSAAPVLGSVVCGVIPAPVFGSSIGGLVVPVPVVSGVVPDVVPGAGPMLSSGFRARAGATLAAVFNGSVVVAVPVFWIWLFGSDGSLGSTPPPQILSFALPAGFCLLRSSSRAFLAASAASMPAWVC